MFTVAITPITVATAAAYSDTSHLHVPTYLAFQASAIAIIAWLNLTNDVFDFDTGIDKHKKESVVNLCGGTKEARHRILLIANAFLFVAFSGLLPLCVTDASFDATIICVIAIAVVGGYMYQGPPFRLGYYGLGEPICFVTWILGVAAAYYSQIRFVPDFAQQFAQHSTLSARLQYLLGELLWSPKYSLFAAAILVAAPTATILLCSHFHQLEDDRNAGKKSPIVRLGTARAATLLQIVLILQAVAEVTLFALGRLPLYPLLFSVIAIPHALTLARFVKLTHAQPEIVRVAKYYAVKFHFVHGMALTFGFLLTGGRGLNNPMP